VGDNSSAQPAFTVVVPTFNALHYLRRTIPPIVDALGHVEGELIVIDNGSDDGSVAWLREHVPSARVESVPGVSIGALRNFGAELGSGELISFVDSDCVVGPDYFLRILEVLGETGAVAAGSDYALPDDPLWVEMDWQALNDQRGGTLEGPVHDLPSGNFACRRAAFEAVGGYDESLETGEDAELCLRLVKNGGTIWHSKRIEAKHLGNPKSLRGFYGKQRWHGLGMFGTARAQRFDKPTLLLFVHILANLVGIACAVVLNGMIGVGLFALLTFVAPAIAVAYRMASSNRPRSILRALLLFHIYLDARVAALWAITLGKVMPRTRTSRQ